MKLYEVTERLYTRGELSPQHIPDLQRIENLHVFALAVPNKEVQAALGDAYHNYPLPDGQVTQDVKRLAHGIASEAAAAWRSWATVLIHCRAGRNRAAFVAALTLRELTGCVGETALEHLQRVRPNAFGNAHFEAYLRELPAP